MVLKKSGFVIAPAAPLLEKMPRDEEKEDMDTMEDNEDMVEWAWKTLQRTQYLSDSDCEVEYDESSSDSELSDHHTSRVQVPAQHSIGRTGSISNVPTENTGMGSNTISAAGNKKLDTDSRRSRSPIVNSSQPLADVPNPSWNATISTSTRIPTTPGVAAEKTLDKPQSLDQHHGRDGSISVPNSVGPVSGVLTAMNRTPDLFKDASCGVHITQSTTESKKMPTSSSSSVASDVANKTECLRPRKLSAVFNNNRSEKAAPSSSISKSVIEQSHSTTDRSKVGLERNFDSSNSECNTTMNVEAIPKTCGQHSNKDSLSDTRRGSCSAAKSLLCDDHFGVKTPPTTGGFSTGTGNPSSLVIFNNRVPLIILEDCMKTRKSLIELNNSNRKRRHNSKEINFCDICNKQFAHKSSFMRHRKTVHDWVFSESDDDDEDFETDDDVCSDNSSEEQDDYRLRYCLRERSRKDTHRASAGGDNADEHSSSNYSDYSDSTWSRKRKKCRTRRSFMRKCKENNFKGYFQDTSAQDNTDDKGYFQHTSVQDKADDKSKEVLDSTEDVQQFQCFLCLTHLENMENLNHHLKVCSQLFLEERNTLPCNHHNAVDKGPLLPASLNTASTGDSTAACVAASSGRPHAPVSEHLPQASVNSFLPEKSHQLTSNTEPHATPKSAPGHVTSALISLLESNARPSISASDNPLSVTSKPLESRNINTISLVNFVSIKDMISKKISELVQRVSSHDIPIDGLPNSVPVSNAPSSGKASSDNTVLKSKNFSEMTQTVSPHSVSSARPTVRVLANKAPSDGALREVSSNDDISRTSERSSESAQRVLPNSAPLTGLSNSVPITTAPSESKASSNGFTFLRPRKLSDLMPKVSPQSVPVTSDIVSEISSDGAIFKTPQHVSELMQGVLPYAQPAAGLSNRILSHGMDSSAVNTLKQQERTLKKITAVSDHGFSYNRSSVIVPVAKTQSHGAVSEVSSKTTNNVSYLIRSVGGAGRTSTLNIPSVKMSAVAADHISEISSSGPHPKNQEVLASANIGSVKHHGPVMSESSHGITFAKPALVNSLPNGAKVTKISQPLFLKMLSQGSTVVTKCRPRFLPGGDSSRSPLINLSHATAVVPEINRHSGTEQVPSSRCGISVTSSGGVNLSAAPSISASSVPVTTICRRPLASDSRSVQPAVLRPNIPNTVSVPALFLVPRSSAQQLGAPLSTNSKHTGDSKTSEVANIPPNSNITISGEGFSMTIPISPSHRRTDQQRLPISDQTEWTQPSMPITGSSATQFTVQSHETTLLNRAVSYVDPSPHNVPGTSTSTTARVEKHTTHLPAYNSLPLGAQLGGGSHLLHKSVKLANTQYVTTNFGDSASMLIPNASMHVAANKQLLPVGEQSAWSQTEINKALKTYPPSKTVASRTGRLIGASNHSKTTTEAKTAGGDINNISDSLPRKVAPAKNNETSKCVHCGVIFKSQTESLIHMRQHFMGNLLLEMYRPNPD